jgi:hypothetical protein
MTRVTPLTFITSSLFTLSAFAPSMGDSSTEAYTMPGSRTSIPYLALPSTFDATSVRPMSSRPISLNWEGFLRSDSSIFGGSAGTVANFTTSPYAMRLPEFLCTTKLDSVLRSPTGTFHWLATLSSSTRRA